MSSENLLMELSPQTSDKLCYSPPEDSDTGEAQDYLIFFMPGNPGLIRYYEPFLSRLHAMLEKSSTSESARFHICGHSFKGFEISSRAKLPSYPLGLEQQIQYQEDLLYHHVRSHNKLNRRMPKVILMGHSVGAYVLLELIKRHQARINGCDEDEDFDLIGAILLFPTITHIAESQLGRFARVVLKIPYFPIIIGSLARSLKYLMPKRALEGLIHFATKFPDYAAKTSAAFLTSPMGVRQALHLARDEMNVITEDKWNDEVWSAATSPGTNERDTANSNLVFYWGEGDRWVANETRDALIKARGHDLSRRSGGPPETWKPNMLIDKEGMPHDFCTTLRNSNSVADQAKKWIDGIIIAHEKAIKKTS